MTLGDKSVPAEPGLDLQPWLFLATCCIMQELMNICTSSLVSPFQVLSERSRETETGERLGSNTERGQPLAMPFREELCLTFTSNPP